MNNIQEMKFDEFVVLSGNKLVTDSRKVAKHFGKRHDNVLRAIESLKKQIPDEFAQLNFEASSYVDATGRRNTLWHMTKDGFVLLVMGFTGEKALKAKLEYIAAFNAMADYISKGQQSLWQQMQALIAREVESKVKASFGSHLMLQRKREIPKFRDEYERIGHEIQPSLLLN